MARKASSTAGAGGRQLRQLRATVNALRRRLEREAKARKLDSRLLAGAKKARGQVAKQMSALRDQGRKLAAQLRAALGDANKREQARKQALAKIAELRADLVRKTGDLKRKSEELRRLAQESAERAREIIRGEGEASAAQPSPDEAPSTVSESAQSRTRSGPDEETNEY